MYRSACRMPPLFQRCQVYDWPPLFDKKYMTDPIFLDCYMKGPTFSDIPVYAHFFHSEIFEAACSLDDCNICLTTSNKLVQKNQWTVYEWVNISDDLVYEWVCFFKGQVYEWGWFRNTGSHTRTKIIPKLSSPTPTHLPALPLPTLHVSYQLQSY